MKKGSGTQLIAGVIILIIGIGIGLSLNSVVITYLAIAAGVAVIISSFLIIIKQGVLLHDSENRCKATTLAILKNVSNTKLLSLAENFRVRRLKSDSCNKA